MKKYAQLLLIVFAFVAGSFATLFTGFAFANGSDPTQIHGCVRNNGLLAGFVRIVGVNVNCANNETALNWKQGLNDPPFSCPGCNFNQVPNIGNRFVGKDFTNSVLPQADFGGTDLSGTTFINADLANATFSSTNLSNANLTGATLKFAHATYNNFSNANLTNVDLTQADLTGSTNMATATLTGVTWSFTTCPDGTLSNNNGNTCVGHLTP